MTIPHFDTGLGAEGRDRKIRTFIQYLDFKTAKISTIIGAYEKYSIPMRKVEKGL
jgi:hypothetical protein